MELVHKGTQTIYTDRLILRRATLDDAQHMFESYMQDEEVTKYVTWYPHKSIDETYEFLSSWVDNYDNEKKYRWVITEKGEDKALGTIDVVVLSDAFQSAEIGYALSRHKWNKGYMSESLKAVIDYLFDMGIHRVQAKHHIDNVASGKVMQKAGMIKESVQHEAAKDKDNRFVDLVMYYILNK